MASSMDVDASLISSPPFSPTPSASPTPTSTPSPTARLDELFRRWGLDASLRRYHGRGLGIETLYPWQATCLAEPGVAEGDRDLLYFAPTSGGKTMVAELLLLLRIMGLPTAEGKQEGSDGGRSGGLETAKASQAGVGKERVRKGIVVLPFISMVTEKVKHLQRVVAPYNRGRPKRQKIKVKALYGGKGARGLNGADIAVCTIEKANALICRMAAAGHLHELACLVVDELHMIGEGTRGQTLELLLTKVLRAKKDTGVETVLEEGKAATAAEGYAQLAVSHIGNDGGSVRGREEARNALDDNIGSFRNGAKDVPIGTGHEPMLASPCRTQVIGMSATLSNGAELASWLGAILHVSDYRPVPLDERILLDMNVHDKAGVVHRTFLEPAHPETDPDHVVTLCRESCVADDQVIIFCSTKQFCHNCAIKVARNLNVAPSKAVASKRSALVAQLTKEMSMGVDPILQETIPHGVAFHHAGLTDTERSAIEKAFRAGTLTVLAATSTLGAGVNLPAGRVILRNLNAVGGGLSATSYRQMAGRAGRKGAGRARGEAFLVAGNKGQARRAQGLMNAGLAAVKSALKPTSDGGAGLTKMILEGVCGKLVRRKRDLGELLGSSLIFHQQPDSDSRDSLLDHAWAALQLLADEGCIETAGTSSRIISQINVPRKGLVGTNAEITAADAVAVPSDQIPYKPPTIRDGGQAGSIKIGATSVAGVAGPAVLTSTAGPTGCEDAQEGEDKRLLVPTKLGLAIFRSSMAPGDGLAVYRDLSGAKNGINLRNTLHLAYLLTPLRPPPGLKPNWERLQEMYSSAKAAAEETPPGRNAHLIEDFHKIGISENQLHMWASRGPSGTTRERPLLSPDAVRGAALRRRGGREEQTLGAAASDTREGKAPSNTAQKAVRLVAAMALKDVSDGYNLGQVARSYGLNKGELQNLRQSAASFAGMVTSFLKELGWTLFLMLVKGHIPKLSLGVSNHLLPLMQVPGMSRTEASALYQGGILNVKNLLGASNDKLATALRVNVPFRTGRPGGGQNGGECVRFERRAQILRNTAKEIDAKREKSNSAQASKLLKAVQGRLGKSAQVDDGGALADLGRGNDLVRFAPEGRKRKRSDQGSNYRATDGRGRGSGGCGDSIVRRLGETGLSDDGDEDVSDDNGVSRRDDDSDNGSDSGTDDSSEVDGDEIDLAVAAFVSGRVQENDDDDDDDNQEDEPPPQVARREKTGVVNRGRENNADHDRGFGSVWQHGKRESETLAVEKAVETSGPESQQVSQLAGCRATVIASRGEGSRMVESSRPPARQEDPRLDRNEFPTTSAAKERPQRSNVRTSSTSAEPVSPDAAEEASSTVIGSTDVGLHAQPMMSREPSPAARAARMIMTPANTRRSTAETDTTGVSPARPKRGSTASCNGTAPSMAKMKGISSPLLREAERLTHPAVPVACSKDSTYVSESGHGGGFVGPGGDARGISAEHVPDLCPAYSACYGSKQTTEVPGLTSSDINLREKPPTSVSPTLQGGGHIGGGNDGVTKAGSVGTSGCVAVGSRNVFADGPTAVTDFSSVWRRARCFSFVLGGRDVPQVQDGRGDARAAKGGSLYRRSWQALTARLPVAPYTVPCAGESFIPLSRHESDDVMRVVSGIAVSFDGKLSHYLPLPPLLPRRLADWYHYQAPIPCPTAIPTSDTNADDRGKDNTTQGTVNTSTAQARHVDCVIAACMNDTGRSAEQAAETVGLTSSLTVQRTITENRAPSRAKVTDTNSSERRWRRDINSRAPGVFADWKGLPKEALNAVTLLVGFPWLCSDCSKTSRAQRRRCHIHRRRSADCEHRRKLKPWNQALLVCRRWNALGVEALNCMTANEPSGRWVLVRDVMEDHNTTKVSLDMKGALVCLRSLGVNVRGPLEDPGVARWLVEPPVEDIAPQQQQKAQQQGTKAKKRKTPLPPPRAPPASLSLSRQPRGFVDLWCMQAAATLFLMAEKEKTLEDLSLSLPFHLIEMPAVAAAACMEYCGVALKVGSISDARRDVGQRLQDLETTADQLVGEQDVPDDKSILASPKRVHDMLYITLGVSPPPSWKSGGGDSRRVPPSGGATKRANLGPTDTNSLQELLIGSGDAGLDENAHVFVRAVIKHRSLAPAKRSLSGLLGAKRWHAHLDGMRVNPRIDLFTTTGRMVTSDPPLQNLDHGIRLTRSWRLSLAEETEAEVPDLEVVPRVWADQPIDNAVSLERTEEEGWGGLPTSQDSDRRESLRAILANSGSSNSMSCGHIVGIVQDRCLDDPIWRPSFNGDDSVPCVRQDGVKSVVPADAMMSSKSMACLWRERGYPYTAWEAKSTPQVLVRLGASRAGMDGKIYSYPADKVFRVQASFLSDAKAESLLGGIAGARRPWFGKEIILKPRDALVAVPGYTFVSADYSQVEMRLMAHLSEDPDLLRDFADGGDVFRRIAAVLQGRGKTAADISDEDRRQTKIVVYGLLYGQTADALAPQLGTSRPRAWKIRAAVLKAYPRLTEFLDRVKKDCKKCGFVETMLGRRRYLPQINSTDVNERSRAERQAANTVCQGSAADLLKLAVNNISARLDECEWMLRPELLNGRLASRGQPQTTSCRFPDDRGRSDLARRPACRLVLSIHDELLYEVLEPYAAEVARIVKSSMEGAFKLTVPLVAHPRLGQVWGSMELIDKAAAAAAAPSSCEEA